MREVWAFTSTSSAATCMEGCSLRRVHDAVVNGSRAIVWQC